MTSIRREKQTIKRTQIIRSLSMLGTALAASTVMSGAAFAFPVNGGYSCTNAAPECVICVGDCGWSTASNACNSFGYGTAASIVADVDMYDMCTSPPPPPPPPPSPPPPGCVLGAEVEINDYDGWVGELDDPIPGNVCYSMNYISTSNGGNGTFQSYWSGCGSLGAGNTSPTGSCLSRIWHNGSSLANATQCRVYAYECDSSPPPPPPPPPPPAPPPVACSAPVMVNGSCSGTAGNCTTGSSTNDNGQTACYTTRTWDCVGSNGGSTANCSVANPLCTCVTGNIRLTMPGKVVSDIDGAATWTTSFGAGITHDGEPCEARASVSANGDTQVVIAAGTFASGSTFCTATTTATVGGVSTTVEVEVSYNPGNGDVHGIATVSPICGPPPPGGTSCTTPWGTTVVDGGSVVAFQNATEPCAGSCTPETRVCNNGTLTGSYTNQNCSIASCPPPPPCTGPVTWTEGGFTCTADGGTVPISSSVSVRDRVYGVPPDGQGVAQFGCDSTGNWVYQGGTCLGGQTCTPPVPEVCP